MLPKLVGEILSRNYAVRTCMHLLHTSIASKHGDYEWKDPKSEDEVVNISFVLRDGTIKKLQGKIGDNAMFLALRHGIDIEGACGGSLACSTCHVYVDEKSYGKLPGAKDEEDDMLDMAPLLKPNSRLSCQIILNKQLDGMVLTLPHITRNFYVDNYIPQPH